MAALAVVTAVALAVAPEKKLAHVHRVNQVLMVVVVVVVQALLTAMQVAMVAMATFGLNITRLDRKEHEKCLNITALMET
jgi:uncharacterized membrane protein YqhA